MGLFSNYKQKKAELKAQESLNQEIELETLKKKIEATRQHKKTLHELIQAQEELAAEEAEISLLKRKNKTTGGFLNGVVKVMLAVDKIEMPKMNNKTFQVKEEQKTAMPVLKTTNAESLLSSGDSSKVEIVDLKSNKQSKVKTKKIDTKVV